MHVKLQKVTSGLFWNVFVHIFCFLIQNPLEVALEPLYVLLNVFKMSQQNVFNDKYEKARFNWF